MKSLSHGNILLRAARCDSLHESLRSQYRGYLSEEELARNARFRFQADSDRHLLGRVLMRSTLAHWLGCAPQELELATDKYGKPGLQGAEENAAEHAPHFNLSHSGNWVVLALSRSPVGVDVEYTRRKNDVLAVAEHYFFGRELDELRSFPGSEQRERFFDYWTLKEAYMKARGEGIALGLENFGFSLKQAAAIELVVDDALDDNPAGWQFLCLSPQPHYRLALANRHSDSPRVTVECLSGGLDYSPLDWQCDAAIANA